MPDTTAPRTPPAHVLAAFGLSAPRGEVLDGRAGRAWRYGDIVLKRSGDPVVSAWIASVFESLRVTDIRVPRPIRSLDGRWAVGGWSAERFLSGRPRRRYRGMVDASRQLTEALRGIPRPRFLPDRDDLRYRADALAWDDVDTHDIVLREGHIARRWRQIAADRTPVHLPEQVVHGELLGHVLFAGSAPPAVVDFFPLFRPADYPAAILVVDAVAWGGAQPELAGSWYHLPQWEELLRRALLYRMAMAAVHPHSTAEAVVGVMTAADLLLPNR